MKALAPEPGSGGVSAAALFEGWRIVGVAIIVFVALATLMAWPVESMVAAQPAARPTGDLTWIRLFAIAQGIGLGLFVAALGLIRRRSPSTREIVMIAAIIQLLPLAAPAMLSTDVYSYWNTGRLAALESANPYLTVPADYPNDPSFAFIPAEWHARPSVYGPAFTALAEVVAVTADNQAQAAAWLFRAIAGASMVAVTVLVSRTGQRSAFAAAFVGWNPVFAFQFAGAGHNDALVATLIVLGVWWMRERRARLAAAAWVLSLFVKSLVLVLIPLQILEDRARRRPSLVPGLIVGTILLAGLSTLAFGLAWAGHVLPVVDSAASADINSLAIWPRVASGLPEVVVKLGPLLVFAIVYLVLLGQAARGRARLGLAMGLFLVASPFLWTWYVITPAALAAVDDDAPALWVALGLCAYTSLYLGASGNAIQLILG